MEKCGPGSEVPGLGTKDSTTRLRLERLRRRTRLGLRGGEGFLKKGAPEVCSEGQQEKEG